MALHPPTDLSAVSRRSLARLALVGAVPAFGAAANPARGEAQREPGIDPTREVREHELAFAATMQARDLDAFAGFIAADASFLNGGQPLRGREAIVTHWKRFFVAPKAPFQWRPDLVEVLPDGLLAMTLGPVSTLDGQAIARFYSVWRREAPGVWKVVFDNGYDTPACTPAAQR